MLLLFSYCINDEVPKFSFVNLKIEIMQSYSLRLLYFLEIMIHSFGEVSNSFEILYKNCGVNLLKKNF